MVIVEAPSTTLPARRSVQAARAMPMASMPPCWKKLASSEASTACCRSLGISSSLSMHPPLAGEGGEDLAVLGVELGDQAGGVAGQRVDPRHVDGGGHGDAGDGADEQRDHQGQGPADQPAGCWEGAGRAARDPTGARSWKAADRIHGFIIDSTWSPGASAGPFRLQQAAADRLRSRAAPPGSRLILMTYNDPNLEEGESNGNQHQGKR